MQKLFGTDGVRGVVNQQITPKLCFNIGRTIGVYLKDNNNKTVVLGYDTRCTCDMIASALCSGIVSQGINVINAGLLTTPALSFLTKNTDAGLGVMITASHNSAEYNGIKIFDHNGNKPSGKMENTLQKIYNHILSYDLTSFDNYGRIYYRPKLKQKYIDYLIKIVKDIDINIKICFDLSNGAANYIIKPILDKCFKNYVIIGDNVNGEMVNKDCGATKLDALATAVKENGCDIGFAFDGDADRVMMIDKSGRVLDGDDMLYILAVYLKENKLLHNDTVVGTIMANFGLENALKQRGVKLVRVSVGDKYIVDYLNSNNLSLGGEQAGHIIISALTNTGDGVLTSFVMLKAMEHYGKHFDNLLGEVVKYPQVIKNVLVDDRKKNELLKHPKILETLNIIEGTLMDDGRIILRASGTEPLIRVMVEGRDKDMIEHLASTMVKSIVDNKN